MFTNKQVATLIAELRAEFRAATPAVAKVAVAQAKFADTEFGQKMLAKAAARPAKVACAIHPAVECNRAFSPASAGTANHVARIEA